MDLDNTLCDDSGSIRQSLIAAFATVAHRFPTLSEETLYQTFRKINNRHWENYDQSPIAAMTDPIAVRTFIANEFLQALGIFELELAKVLAIRFQEARRTTYACYADTLPFLQRHKGQIHLVLITNGNSEMQREKISRCGLEPWLDSIIVAQERGVSKPSPEIFQHALEAVSSSPGETLMVGDHPEKDIWGAQSVGLLTAWMRRDGRKADTTLTVPDYIVRSMAEVQEIIERHGTA